MPVKKNTPPVKASTQDFIEIDEVKDDIVVMKNRSAVLVIEVGTVNYWLLSTEEQEAIIAAYSKLLNSLSFPVQILIISKKTDVSTYIDLITNTIKKQTDLKIIKRLESYRDFIKTTVKKAEVLAKNFYFAIPFSPYELGPVKSLQNISPDYLATRAKTSLYPKKDHLIRLLSQLGLKAIVLQKQALIELFHNLYNAGQNNLHISQAGEYTNVLVSKQT
jgi:hypothetical protein